MHLIDEALLRLRNGQPLAQVSILHQDGSTPRTAGARMLVFVDGTIAGTIGGGQVEAMAMDQARHSLQSGQASRAEFDLTGKRDQGMDMICGGRLEALIEPVLPDSEMLPVLEAARECLSKRRPFTLHTALREKNGTVSVEHGLFTAAQVSGAAELKVGGSTDHPELKALLEQAGNTPWKLLHGADADWLIEFHQPRETVYLFGGGHVAQQIARVAHLAHFRIAVLDDRPEVASKELFPQAELRLSPPALDNVFGLPELAGEPMDHASYAVIVTRGHRHDGLILEQALRTGAGYLGMIGSKSKRDATYRNLRTKGFGDRDFARVHCPIGLKIGAQTPEEIAVSVVAELIQHRAKAAKGAPRHG